MVRNANEEMVTHFLILLSINAYYSEFGLRRTDP